MLETIASGLDALGLTQQVPAQAAEQLAEYGRLLLEKNQVMNLTAIRDPLGVAQLHMLDCAALLGCAASPPRSWRAKPSSTWAPGRAFPAWC